MEFHNDESEDERVDIETGRPIDTRPAARNEQAAGSNEEEKAVSARVKDRQ